MSDTADPTDAARDPANRVGYYHPATIVAHWTVVMLLLFQFATGGAMEAAFERATGAGYPLRLEGPVWVHGMIGSSIGLLMVWRLAIRLTHYVPPPPSTLPRVLQIVSRATHWTFYVLLIGMPIAGIAAVWTRSETIATIHGLTGILLFFVVLLHVAGGLYHAFKRDGVVKRMLRQDPAGQYDARTDRPAA